MTVAVAVPAVFVPVTTGAFVAASICACKGGRLRLRRGGDRLLVGDLGFLGANHQTSNASRKSKLTMIPVLSMKIRLNVPPPPEFPLLAPDHARNRPTDDTQRQKSFGVPGLIPQPRQVLLNGLYRVLRAGGCEAATLYRTKQKGPARVKMYNDKPAPQKSMSAG